MREIKAYIRPSKLESVLDELHAHPELPGVTCSEVTGFGRYRPSSPEPLRCSAITKLEMVVPDEQVDEVLEIVLRCAHTGRTGDGMVFVSPVERSLRIRTGRAEGP